MLSCSELRKIHLRSFVRSKNLSKNLVRGAKITNIMYDPGWDAKNGISDARTNNSETTSPKNDGIAFGFKRLPLLGGF